MEKFLECLGITAVCLLLIFFVSYTNAEAAEKQELYVDNNMGGVLVITLEKCTIEGALQEKFDKRGYSTDDKGNTLETCWMVPDISKAPPVEGMKAVPTVNFWYNGQVFAVRTENFKPLKEKKFVPDL